MRRVKKSPYSRLRKNKKAASPAISMVIITAVTVVLVLVTGNYAYQVLDRQRGASEFDAVQKSFVALDDAMKDVAWDKDGSRSARFTVKYGSLEFMPSNAVKGLPLSISVSGYPVTYSGYTGYLRYNLSTNYVTFGNGYNSYLFGDNKTVISKSTESFGFALIEQRPSWVSLTLCYRPRAMRSSVVQVGSDTINYVDILIINVTTTKWSTNIGDFDVIARNMAITTITHGPYNVIGSSCTVSVSLGGSSSSIPIWLVSGKVVFNFVTAKVQVST